MSFQCPSGDVDRCEEYKCRKSGVCRQSSRPLQQGWRCMLCGQPSDDCAGHTWGGRTVKAPYVRPDQPQP